MEQEKLKLKQTAEQLAERYEDTKDKQEEITKRQDIGCIIYCTDRCHFMPGICS
jgi:Nuclear pore component.